MGTLILNKEEDKRRETITVNMIFAVKIFSYIFIRRSKYDSFHVFQFISFHPSGILRTHNGSPVGLISSMDSVASGCCKAHGSIPNQA